MPLALLEGVMRLLGAYICLCSIVLVILITVAWYDTQKRLEKIEELLENQGGSDGFTKML